MCELISWCEKDGDVFYLTDKEADIMVNEYNFGWYDVIGHHAIQKFWKVEKPCRHSQFPIDSNTDKMPDEILKALESGKFNRMMKETRQHLKHVGNNCFVWKKFCTDGTLMYEQNYKDGKFHGVHKTWWPNGTLKYEENYKDGKKHGVYKVWHSNGTLWYEYNFKNGKRHGIYKTWRPDGTLRHEQNYKNGKLHGVYKVWRPDGTLEYECNFKDGVRIY